SLKAVKFDLLRDVLTESHWSEAEIAQLYDSAIHQACLRVLHDLFAADEAEVISYVTFNGWVNFTDKIRDTPARARILTVQADRNGIMQANLLTPDPKAIFRRLKGLSGMKLSNLDPVVPIMWLERDRLVANDSIEMKVQSLPPSLVQDLATPSS